MRTLYLSGLVVLDLAVLALGAAMLATMDLDKAGTLGVVATVPVVLLVLSDLPVAHLALRRTDGPGLRDDRRTTVLLASALTAAGALPLLLVTAAAGGPVLLAAACGALGALALVYAFVVGDRVAARHRSRVSRRTPGTTLVRRRPPGYRAGMPVLAREGRTRIAATSSPLGRPQRPNR